MRLIQLIVFACVLPAAAQSPRLSTNQLLAEARSSQQSSDLATAARDYRLVVDAHPNNAEARLGLGSVLTREQQYDEAIVQLQAALPLASSKHRSSVLSAIGLAYTRKGDIAAARAPLQEALTLQPNNAQAARLLAEAALTSNDAEAALAVLIPRAGAAALDPDFGRVFGVALVRTGKLFDGAQALQHSAEATGDAGVFRLSGIAYLDSGDSDSARRQLEIARRIDPALPDIDLLVSIARERCGDHYAAEIIFRDTLKAQPEDFNANLYLGSLLLKRQGIAAATPYLNHALALRPTDPLALYEGAMLSKANQQPGPAAESLLKASVADPSWPEPHLQLATLDDNQHHGADAAKERALAASLTAAQLHTGSVSPHLP